MNDSRLAARLRVGLVVNPWAGIGGPAGLRGSDGVDIRATALERGSLPTALSRVSRFLAPLTAAGARIDWVTWGGEMGAESLAAQGVPVSVLGMPSTPSTADDTRTAARALVDAAVDVLVFAGGDGTARDVCAAIGTRVPALGLPAGVKMYSGVFAVSPEAAAEVVLLLAAGKPVPLATAEVRDIDEEAFRHDRVASRFYGELNVPGTREQLQHIKCAAPLVEALVRDDIAAGVAERLAPGELCLVGTGSTPKALLGVLGLSGSLLGIDAVCDGVLVGTDLDARAAMDLALQYPQRRLLLTATGGQGFLLGRGNQQLSAEVVRLFGRENLIIVATPGKLAALDGRPLLVDTGDPQLDCQLAGLHPVWTGYGSRVLYPVRAAGAVSAQTAT